MEQQTWECLFDTRSGRYFFHNELTGSTTWELPADWQRMWFIDSQYRTRYFQDRMTGEVGWASKSGLSLEKLISRAREGSDTISSEEKSPDMKNFGEIDSSTASPPPPPATLESDSAIVNDAIIAAPPPPSIAEDSDSRAGVISNDSPSLTQAAELSSDQAASDNVHMPSSAPSSELTTQANEPAQIADTSQPGPSPIEFRRSSSDHGVDSREDDAAARSNESIANHQDAHAVDGSTASAHNVDVKTAAAAPQHEADVENIPGDLGSMEQGTEVDDQSQRTENNTEAKSQVQAVGGAAAAPSQSVGDQEGAGEQSKTQAAPDPQSQNISELDAAEAQRRIEEKEKAEQEQQRQAKEEEVEKERKRRDAEAKAEQERMRKAEEAKEEERKKTEQERRRKEEEEKAEHERRRKAEEEREKAEQERRQKEELERAEQERIRKDAEQKAAAAEQERQRKQEAEEAEAERQRKLAAEEERQRQQLEEEKAKEERAKAEAARKAQEAQEAAKRQQQAEEEEKEAQRKLHEQKKKEQAELEAQERAEQERRKEEEQRKKEQEDAQQREAETALAETNARTTDSSVAVTNNSQSGNTAQEADAKEQSNSVDPAARQKALQALANLAGITGTDSPLTLVLGMAIARNIVTAKEISHIQKALRKKKHDANYYVTKWQKKVKYADELKAWEKQQEAVLKAQKEQEQLRRNGQAGSEPPIDPERDLNLSPRSRSERLRIQREERLKQLAIAEQAGDDHDEAEPAPPGGPPPAKMNESASNIGGESTPAASSIGSASDGVDPDVFQTIVRLVQAPNPWGDYDPKNRAQFLHIKTNLKQELKRFTTKAEEKEIKRVMKAVGEAKKSLKKR
eukprot:INCI7671.2.p1 GENE.INCI7671.2~~INCI7671.2.p1  ORF type:complete len:856 (+),score=235.69 INCI7671.2:190-2757(+)